jgi:hypothetical protein
MDQQPLRRLLDVGRSLIAELHARAESASGSKLATRLAENGGVYVLDAPTAGLPPGRRRAAPTGEHLGPYVGR